TSRPRCATCTTPPATTTQRSSSGRSAATGSSAKTSPLAPRSEAGDIDPARTAVGRLELGCTLALHGKEQRDGRLMGMDSGTRRGFWSTSPGWSVARSLLLAVVAYLALSLLLADWLALVLAVVVALASLADFVRAAHRR